MEIQLSSGSGPTECELAVSKLLASLVSEFADIKVIEKTEGSRKGCFRSVKISTDNDLLFLEGTVQWICKSPFRPHHGRKNWFVDISLCHTVSVECKKFDESEIRFETFRSSGKGGQHVNKVETGVRAIHISTGISVACTEERSQHINKQIAIKRLCELIESRNTAHMASAKSENRLEHTRIERGNPVRVYEGMDFRLIKCCTMKAEYLVSESSILHNTKEF